MIQRFILFCFSLTLIGVATFFWVSPDLKNPSLWEIVFGAFLFFISFMVSALLTPLMIWFSKRIHFVDHPKGRKSHTQATPLGGGIPIFLSVNAVILGGLGALWLFSTKLTTPEWKVWIPVEIQLYLPGIFNQAPLLFTLLTGGSFLFLLGLYDDRRPLPAKVKLGLQLGVAFFFLIHFLDVESEERSIQFLVRFYWISFPLLLLWIVGITNAFNLLDNMDGLSSGVVFISALNLLMVCLNTKQPFVGALLLVLMGANLGFLLYNFSPAKIFMGDCGSLFMGYLIAVSMILCFTAQEGEWFYPLVVPLLILAVPLYDTFSVMWIRLRSGRSIFQADNHHFSHRLVALGFSRPAAVCLIYLVTFTTGITATLLDRVDLRGGILISLQVFCTLMIIALLEGSSLPKKEESVKK